VQTVSAYDKIVSDWISEVVVALAMFAILVLAILKISNKRKLPWTALLLIASSLLVPLTSIFHPVYTLRIANWPFFSLFFGYVSVALFSFLRTGGRNQPSQIRCVPRPVSDPWNVLLGYFQLNARGASGIVHGDSANSCAGFAAFPSLL
jgi:hypothetical protein